MRTGNPVRNLCRMIAVSTPITEPYGPVMPQSVWYAVPPGKNARIGGGDVRVRPYHG